MRKVIRGYAKDKNLNLILIGAIPGVVTGSINETI